MNGRNDIFHEKAPVFPFYSLPFRGDSYYKEQFTEEQQQKLGEHKRMMA